MISNNHWNLSKVLRNLSRISCHVMSCTVLKGGLEYKQLSVYS